MGNDDAYELALRALNRKERTESELRVWLAEREVGEAEIEEVIPLLAEAGAIDDRSFARRFAEDKRELAGWGPDRIARALETRGVRAEHIEEAIGGEDEVRQLERATALLSLRAAGLRSDRERERALALLVRRGYSLDLAYDAVRSAERATLDAA
ncbi:MAG: regulatory protein RecX [Solirubrobacterales bacterium]